MNIRNFVVHHEPVGQPRHRVSTRGGFAKMYLPSRHPVHAFKRAIRLAFGAKNAVACPVGVIINVFFSRPKSKVWKRKEMPRYVHTIKPDIDNVVKAIFDALTGYAWQDDCQVFGLTVMKFVCSGDESPRVEIAITIAQDKMKGL